MDGQDWEVLGLYAVLAMVGVAMVLHARVLRNHAETLIRHDEDILFLRDAARAMEGKLADD